MLHFPRVPRSFLNTSAVTLLTFHVAFTQPSCPAMNTPLLRFNLRNLLPLCWSVGVASVTVLSAVLKWNRNVCCRGALALYVTSECTPIYTVRFCRMRQAYCNRFRFSPYGHIQIWQWTWKAENTTSQLSNNCLQNNLKNVNVQFNKILLTLSDSPFYRKGVATPLFIISLSYLY